MKVKVHRLPLPPPLPFPKSPSVNNVSKYPHPPWEHISLLLPSDLQTYILKMRFHDTIADVRRHIDAVRYAVLKPETQTCETKIVVQENICGGRLSFEQILGHFEPNPRP